NYGSGYIFVNRINHIVYIYIYSATIKSMADDNKEQSQLSSSTAAGAARESFDHLTVLQEAPESDLSAKQYTAEEVFPEDANQAAIAHAKDAVSGLQDAETRFSTLFSGVTSFLSKAGDFFRSPRTFASNAQEQNEMVVRGGTETFLVSSN